MNHLARSSIKQYNEYRNAICGQKTYIIKTAEKWLFKLN